MSNNPFAPQDFGNKHKFGKLNLFYAGVALESGASYSQPGLTDDEGNPRVFNGKRRDDNRKTKHIVLELTSRKKDGSTYKAIKDCLTGDPAYKKIVYPALMAHFGADLAGLIGQQVWAEVEEVPTGESYTSRTQTDEAGNPKVVEKTTWRVLRSFDNPTACEKAEKEHFASFGNGDSQSGIPADVQVQVKALAQSLAGTPDTFYGILKSTEPYKSYKFDDLMKVVGL